MIKEVLVLDLETTGFNVDNSAIVEIAILALNLDSGVVSPWLDKIVYEKNKPLIEDAWIFQNSTLTQEMVTHGAVLYNQSPLWHHIQYILDRYNRSGIFAFNQNFDFRFLESRGFTLPPKLDDPMKLSRDLVEALDKNERIKNPTAEEAYNYFFPGENYIEKHRAGDDARHEAAIYYQLYQLYNL